VPDEAATVVRFPIGDRNSKFTRAFDHVGRAVGAEGILTPIQAPNANADAERWVGTVRREWLDHLLIAGRRQLGRVLDRYVEHDNRHRPHRGLGLSAPEPSERCQQVDASAAVRQLHRRDVLGGLLHEYERSMTTGQLLAPQAPAERQAKDPKQPPTAGGRGGAG
jgi:putative transposase